jgi:hypothetical protein
MDRSSATSARPNPPSKAPLLTLLKQARAFGLEVVLATSGDLDYKGLANAGTWFLGRLQTELDKMRVLDGLEGAAACAGARFDRRAMEEILAGLGSRVFLMNDVRDDAPVVFQTRWTMSYLTGPISREQIHAAMAAPDPPGRALAPRYAGRRRLRCRSRAEWSRKGSHPSSPGQPPRHDDRARRVAPPSLVEASRGRAPGARLRDSVLASVPGTRLRPPVRRFLIDRVRSGHGSGRLTRLAPLRAQRRQGVNRSTGPCSTGRRRSDSTIPRRASEPHATSPFSPRSRAIPSR